MRRKKALKMKKVSLLGSNSANISCNNIPVEGKSISVCTSTDYCGPYVDIGLSYELNNEKLKHWVALDVFPVLANGDLKDDDKVASIAELGVNSGTEAVSMEKSTDNLSDSHPVIHPHEPNSPTKVEVAGSCIDLFVEVSGPLDGVSYISNSMNDTALDSVRGESDLNFLEEKGEGDIGNEKSTFDVGDFVWARTLTEVWWPAVICDPSTSANKAPKAIKRGTIFVKYFGSRSYVWCKKLDLKPFFENFNQMSGQCYSRSFCGAVEKAVSIIGQVITKKMTCPCFSKEEQQAPLDQVISESGDHISKLGVVYSPSQFEPRYFISRIRDMARTSHVHGKLDLTELKNHLSAFHKSVGHRQLPLHLIKSNEGGIGVSEAGSSLSRPPENSIDAAAASIEVDSAMSSSGKVTESRERKKSKYLSYPYVYVKRKSGKGTGEIKLGSDSTASSKSTVSVSPTGKNDQKKVSTETSIKVNHVVNKEEHMDSCSSKLLAELRSRSRNFSEYSDSLKECSVGFRNFAFVNADVACDEVQTTEIPVVKDSENRGVNVTSVVKDSEQLSNMNVEQKQDMPASSFDTGKTISRDGSLMISFQQTCSDSVQTKATTQGGVIDEAMSRLPDLNENRQPISFEEVPFQAASRDVGGGNPVQGKGNDDTFISPDVIRVKQMSFGSITSLEDARVALRNSNTSNVGIDGPVRYHAINKLNPNQPNASFGSASQIKVPMALFPSIVEPKIIKKRKQDEKAPEVASGGIPDLNGNISDNKTFPESKPEENSTTLRKNEQPPLGASLLLGFASNCTLPPREVLVTTFSRYGLLKESEIEVVDECTIRIPYERITEARFAFQSLEKNKPFGEALASFKLDCPPQALLRPVKRRFTMKNQQPFPPRDPGNAGEPPGIAFMKQNVEKMRSTLEKAGASLSLELRTKLENEIKIFLDKISSMS